jgi:hypothetical protein
MSLVDELENELILFYKERFELSKADNVKELMRNHSAEAIAVSLSGKYGLEVLWIGAPKWAMVAEAAAPPVVGNDQSNFSGSITRALLVLGVLLLVYAGGKLM